MPASGCLPFLRSSICSEWSLRALVSGTWSLEVIKECAIQALQGNLAPAQTMQARARPLSVTHVRPGYRTYRSKLVEKHCRAPQQFIHS